MNKTKVALYVRVSTAEQADNYSIPEQIERMKSYCKSKDWEVYKVYTDAGFTGANIERPGMQSLIEDAEHHIFDMVLVYKLDRLSRDLRDTLYLIDDVFAKNNIQFSSITEGFDTSTEIGRLVLKFLSIFAEMERSRISERMRMGKEARIKEGKWCGGTEPIGYNYDDTKDLLIPNDYELMQVVELATRFHDGERNLRALQREFMSKGYKHKYGDWEPKSMRRVLRSKVYCGYMRELDQWHKASHYAPLSEDVVNANIKMLDERAEEWKFNKHKAGVQTTYLGGLLFCKHCGGKYAKNSGRTRSDGTKNIYYACYSRSKKVQKMIKDPNCMNKNWRMDYLDDLVFHEIRKLAENTDRIKQMHTKSRKAQEEPDKANIILKEIEKIDSQISRFMDLYGLGTFSINQVSEKINPLNERKNALQKELAKINSSMGKITVEQAIEYVTSFDGVLANENFDEIRTLIESLIYYIEIDNDNISIHWRFA